MLIPEHKIHNLLFNPAAVIDAGLVCTDSLNNTANPKTTQSLWDKSAGIIRERNNNPAPRSRWTTLTTQKTPTGLNLYLESFSGSLPGKEIITAAGLLSARTTVKLDVLC